MAGLVRRFLVPLLGVVATTLTAVAPSTAAPAAATPAAVPAAPRYVALGDSAAAGPLVPDLDPEIACLRSTANYPAVAAKLLDADLVDVTCSGAQLPDLVGSRFGLLPPQHDALDPGTDLVTLSVGGNDVGLFEAALSCVNALPEPAGSSCADRYTAGGRDRLAEAVEAIRHDFRAELDEIGRLAPHAQLVVTGYGTYFRPGGCHPREPFWGRDADYVQGSVDALSRMIEQETASHGGAFVDLATRSEGHDVCAEPEEKFYEGVVPSTPAVPMHPNAAGMSAFGAAVAEVAEPGLISGSGR